MRFEPGIVVLSSTPLLPEPPDDPQKAHKNVILVGRLLKGFDLFFVLQKWFYLSTRTKLFQLHAYVTPSHQNFQDVCQ